MILRLAVEGAQRLVRRGHFPRTAAHDAVMAEWQLAANNVLGFLEGCCRLEITGDQVDTVPAELLFGEYRTWCFDGGLRPLGRNEFYREMRAREIANRGIHEKHKADVNRVFCGIRMRKPV